MGSISVDLHKPWPSLRPQPQLFFPGPQGVRGGPIPWTLPGHTLARRSQALDCGMKPRDTLRRPRLFPGLGWLFWEGGVRAGGQWKAGKRKGRNKPHSSWKPGLFPVKPSPRPQWVCPQRSHITPFLSSSLPTSLIDYLCVVKAMSVFQLGALGAGQSPPLCSVSE